jgi:hypothetical protein
MKPASQHDTDENALMYEKFRDALTPGLHIEFDPDEAHQVGAFVEDALSLDEASDSCLDSEERL